MKILFDTNLVLDLLLDRAPWSDSAAELIDLVERGELTGVLGATTLTTIHYVAARARNPTAACTFLEDLLRLFEIAPVTRSVLESALLTGIKDFDDAVLHEAGREAGVEAVVTRDPSGFAAGALAVYVPRELLAALAQAEAPIVPPQP